MFFKKKIEAISCGHKHCVVFRFRNDGTNNLLEGFEKYVDALEAEPEQADEHSLKFSSEYLSPALRKYKAVQQFAEQYGPGSLSLETTMERNGDLLVHLKFRSNSAMKRFKAMAANLSEDAPAAMRQAFPAGLPKGMIAKDVSGMSLADFQR